MSKKIFIIAGEPSGDLHGSNLIKSLCKQSPNIQIVGMGGDLMQAAGAKLFYDINKISVLGFSEVIKKLPTYKKIFKDLSQKLGTEKPNVVVLIDYPGFNLRFAKEAKKRNIPVIYYISPQVWAWHKGRIKTIKKFVDKMLVLFEFEKDLYKQYGIDAVFVGHPLIDVVKTQTADVGANGCSPLPFGLDPTKKTIALLPGSRKTEVKKILPIMLKSAQIINSSDKACLAPTQFILIKSPIVEKNVYENIIVEATRRAAPTFSINIIDQNRYDAIAISDFALVASGTATLETALLGVPMALVYKVSFLTWLIARLLIKIPYIGLVNVVAGEKIVPEFIQFRARPEKIAMTCINLLNSPAKISFMQSQLTSVKEKLGASGASKRAAEEILKTLNSDDTNPGAIG